MFGKKRKRGSKDLSKATEKLKTDSFVWLLAVEWSKWRRLQRESSDKLETPQGIARGGSKSPRGKRSHLRKVTAVFNTNLELCTLSVASTSRPEPRYLSFGGRFPDPFLVYTLWMNIPITIIKSPAIAIPFGKGAESSSTSPAKTNKTCVDWVASTAASFA